MRCYTSDLFFSTIGFFFYSPLGLNFINVGGKPIDITFSDIFVFILLFAYLWRTISTKVTKSEKQLLCFVGIAYFLFLLQAMIGAIESNSLIPLFSAMKYGKAYLALFAGMCFSHFCTVEYFWRVSAIASFEVVACLSITQFIVLARFIPRWGEFIFGMPVYGFPNSSSQYLVILLMFFVIALFRRESLMVYGLSGLVTTLFMAMSLSRSASVIMLLFYVFVFLSFLSIKNCLRIMPVLVLIAVVIVGFDFNSILNKYDETTKAINALKARLDRTFYSDDPTSGRLAIANETLSLIAEKPLLGYKFESFSNYHHGHSTPHNQYLEGLFKTGFLGMLLYISILSVLGWVVFRNCLKTTIPERDRKSVIIFFCAFTTLLFGNLSQPNFTYSQTGNVIFFMFGFLALAKFPGSCRLWTRRCKEFGNDECYSVMHG